MTEQNCGLDVQDEKLDRVDTYEEALLELSKVVAGNSQKLDAIIAHFDVPYKPPMGFMKDEPPVD